MFLCQAVTEETSGSILFSFGHHTTTKCIVLHEIAIVSSSQRHLAGWPREVSTTRSGPIRSDRKPFEKPTFALFWEWQQVNSTSASYFLPIRAKKQMLPRTRNETSLPGLFSDLAHGLCVANLRSCCRSLIPARHKLPYSSQFGRAVLCQTRTISHKSWRPTPHLLHSPSSPGD